jgi:hypothetical protein
MGQTGTASSIDVATSPGQRHEWGRCGYLLSPIFLVALAALIVNDHFIKGHFPGVISGKLSDVAGLIFFPILLVAVAELGALGLPGRPFATARWFLYAAAITAVGYVGVKYTFIGQHLYLNINQWIASVIDPSGALTPRRIVVDPWDLLPLMALVIPVIAGRQWRSTRPTCP